MKRKILFSFAVIGLAVASAKSYTVQLLQPAMIGTVELKPGEYSVEVVNDKAVVRNGRLHTEAAVKVEANGDKYGGTSVLLNDVGGKMHIREIHLGGTKTRLVFNE